MKRYFAEQELFIGYTVSPSRFALVHKIIRPLDQGFWGVFDPGWGYSQGNSHLKGTVRQRKPSEQPVLLMMWWRWWPKKRLI
jgi:hypothetical protein